MGIVTIEPARGTTVPLSTKSEFLGKAGAGIEPANSGFADRSLTTWLPRRRKEGKVSDAPKQCQLAGVFSDLVIHHLPIIFVA